MAKKKSRNARIVLVSGDHFFESNGNFTQRSKPCMLRSNSNSVTFRLSNLLVMLLQRLDTMQLLCKLRSNPS
jgi:hypothetical protein